MPIKKKTEKREAAREAKALTAARLEKSLERELIARLKSRQYGDQPLNINEDVWQAVLNREKEVEAEKELEELGMESDETTEDEDSDDMENELEDEEDDREFVSDLEDESDLEDVEDYDMNGAEVSPLIMLYMQPALLADDGGVATMQFGSESEFDDDDDDSAAADTEGDEDDDSDDEAAAPVGKGKRKAVGPTNGKGANGKAPAKKPRRSECQCMMNYVLRLSE